MADFRGDILVTREQEKLLVSDVSSFIVAYSSGEILDSERMFEPQPEGIFYIARKIEETQDVLRGEELEAGKASVEIRFGICSSRPREPYYYSTTLKNISQSKLRIVKFGGYSKDGNEWILNTITRGFFTGEQFKQWYGVDNDGWIKPGQEVTDPNNYGGPTGLWTYYCVTDTDEQFITGGIVDWFGVQKDKERA